MVHQGYSRATIHSENISGGGTLNILVMGGTTFIGLRLVQRLLDEGYCVTIATRGRTRDPFKSHVRRIRFERSDRGSMETAFSKSRFDIVFDQIGYAPDDIADACAVFSGKIGHYIFTSSNAVYSNLKGSLTEGAFDPTAITLQSGRMDDLGYAEGKRQAEAHLFQRASFPVAAARFPIVVGPDDPSDRFQFHVRRVLEGTPIIVPQPGGQRSYVEVDDAARFLVWLGVNTRMGPYNGASPETINALELVGRIGHILNRDPLLHECGDAADHTPYQTPDSNSVPLRDGESPNSRDWTVDVSKAANEGFNFTPFGDWFPAAVKEVAKKTF